MTLAAADAQLTSEYGGLAIHTHWDERAISVCFVRKLKGAQLHILFPRIMWVMSIINPKMDGPLLSNWMEKRSS